MSPSKCNWFNHVSSIKLLLFRNCACCSWVSSHSAHPYSYTDIGGVWGLNLWPVNSHFTRSAFVNTPWWSSSFARTCVRTLRDRLTPNITNTYYQGAERYFKSFINSTIVNRAARATQNRLWVSGGSSVASLNAIFCSPCPPFTHTVHTNTNIHRVERHHTD